jgi:Transposase, Mutator family
MPPSRTVAPYSPARTAFGVEAVRVTAGIRRLSYGIPTPLERVNREIGRRTDVVGIFPNDRSLIRLAASVVIEQNDEWLVGRRYLSNHSLEVVLDQEKREDQDRKEARELTTA